VTGACYFLEGGTTRILVDCGMQQGSSREEKKNKNPFPFDPSSLDALFITHAHIDHIGRVPKLVKEGFAGPIFSTAPTKDAASHLLEDAHHLMEQDASSARDVIYGVEDINASLEMWKTIPYHEIVRVKDAEIELYDAGHILGSASVVIAMENKRIVFSGDLGNIPAPLVKPTEYIENADYALIESAYGNRVHEGVEERVAVVEDMIEDTVRSKGALLIPAFAMERTQQLLFEINELVERGRIPPLPVFIDSPLAIRLTEIFKKYVHDPMFFNQEIITQGKEGDQIFNFPGLRFTLTTEESKEINSVSPPKVIIAGAGMSNGGRIIHHEVRYLPDPNSNILFVGYQVEGSLGRKILEGEKEVKILGQRVPVKARVKAIGGFSAHADQPLLLRWVSSMKKNLKHVFVVQGEEDQSLPLATKIRDELAIDATAPQPGTVVEL